MPFDINENISEMLMREMDRVIVQTNQIGACNECVGRCTYSGMG